MVRHGPKLKTELERKRDIELEAIIEDMGAAMRTAHKPYIALGCFMTPRQNQVWGQYRLHCETYRGQ